MRRRRRAVDAHASWPRPSLRRRCRSPAASSPCIGSNARLSSSAKPPSDDPREIDEKVDALGGRDEELAAPSARCSSSPPSVPISENGIGSPRSSRSAKAIDARVRRVEDAEAIARRGDVEVRPRREIDERLVAVPSVHQVARRRRVAVGRAAAPIVEHERNLGLARARARAPARSASSSSSSIDEKSEQAAVRLARGRCRADAGGTSRARRDCEW